MRSSIRVRGVTYSAPDAAYVAAADLEDRADTIASNLRRSGRDAEAEQVADRARADAERLRAWAREREEADAAATAQPADTPPPSSSAGPGLRRRDGAPKGRSTRRARGGGSGPRSSSRSGGVRLTPTTRTIIVGTRLPAATTSATALALQVLGLTIGVAFLTLLLTNRGVSAFGSLAGGVSGGLRWLLDPVDPLAPRNDFTAPRSSSRPVPNGGDFAKTTTTARVTVSPLAVAGVG